MRYNKIFSISQKEGTKFSILSKDYNKIHLDKIEGYNSIFGDKICHGCLILLKIIKHHKISNFSNFKINFNLPFFYNDKITSIKKKNYINIFQNKKLKSKLIFNSKIEQLELKQKKINLKKFKYNKVKKYLTNQTDQISRGICYISYFAGMVCPGRYSIINYIKISKLHKKKTEKIVTQKIINTPFFKNSFALGNFFFEFETTERPMLKKKNFKIPKKIEDKAKKFRKNILIIGASSGIGNEILQIFRKNKLIKIYATYLNNKITFSQKNIIKIKLNLEKNLDIVKNLIKQKEINHVYYFATPKININNNDEKYKKTMKKYYIDLPIKILSFSKNLKMFYPSTNFINEKNFNTYANIKYLAENRIIKKNKNSIICRLPEINTKNNLSFFKRKLPSFIDYITKNNKVLKLVFFNF